MKAIIQRIENANVRVNGNLVGEAGKGLLVLLGVSEDDTVNDVSLMVEKVSHLRIFSDENDKMNLSALDVNADIMVVSNFTLCADTKKGNRPSFINAMKPDEANNLYLLFADYLKKKGLNISTGEFGEDMHISTILDGPITIILDTTVWRKK